MSDAAPPSTAGDELATTYDDAFYAELAGGVRGSADTIVPIVVGALHPSSVLDVGCGKGTWLAAFTRAGITDFLGVDGPHVHADDLEIPPDRFVARDLREPLDLGRRFDLAVSLEVAEHLDEPNASTFVASLVHHAPAVLFSAAIPFQGGAGHVNERWPSYWAAHFEQHGYAPFDVVRPAVWDDERVAFWYAQNTMLYVERAHAATLGLTAAVPGQGLPFDVVHPGLHVRDHTTVRPKPAPPSLSRSLKYVRAAAWRAVAHRTRRTPPT